MQEMIRQLMIQAGVYFGIFILTFLVLNAQSKGMLIKYIMVKAKKKTKLLILIRGVTGHYVKVGKIKKSELHWKSASGDKCSAPMDFDFVFEFNGVSAITYNEVTNTFIKVEPDVEVNKGIDPIKVDIMVQRAYLLGLVQQANMILFVLIAVIVTALAVFFCIYKTIMIDKHIAELRALFLNMTSMPPGV